jgi:hypothetical protein
LDRPEDFGAVHERQRTTGPLAQNDAHLGHSIPRMTSPMDPVERPAHPLTKHPDFLTTPNPLYRPANPIPNRRRNPQFGDAPLLGTEVEKLPEARRPVLQGEGLARAQSHVEQLHKLGGNRELPEARGRRSSVSGFLRSLGPKRSTSAEGSRRPASTGEGGRRQPSGRWSSFLSLSPKSSHSSVGSRSRASSVGSLNESRKGKSEERSDTKPEEGSNTEQTVPEIKVTEPTPPPHGHHNHK